MSPPPCGADNINSDEGVGALLSLLAHLCQVSVSGGDGSCGQVIVMVVTRVGVQKKWWLFGVSVDPESSLNLT